MFDVLLYLVVIITIRVQLKSKMYIYYPNYYNTYYTLIYNKPLIYLVLDYELSCIILSLSLVVS